ncbi:TPA: HNH endonuclease [Klebsiella aerogenes]|nr:HNH endonuclease [Klebsiella aerogenes]
MKISPQKAIAIYQKTKGHCGYCGCYLEFEGYTADHIVPKSKGGSHEVDNLLPCCKTCNRTKGARSLHEFRLVTAARNAGCNMFSALQLAYLADAGVLPSLGIDAGHRFYFEKSSMCEGGEK